MTLGREKRDGYRLSICYVAWVYEKAEGLTGVHRPARDQWLRASQSIPLNIAEGNGKTADADRRRYFEIAGGSARECAAIQLSWLPAKRWNARNPRHRKMKLDRIAAMLSRLVGRGYQVHEEQEDYGTDFDPESDFDLDDKDGEPQPSVPGDA